MNDIRVPEQIRVLGTEAERLRDTIATALLRDEPASAPIDLPLVEVGGIVAERLVDDVTALVNVLNGPIARQGVRHDDGDVTAVYRAVGRLEAILDRLIDTWRAARDIPVAPDEAYPQALLADGVRTCLIRSPTFSARSPT